ncbi:zinc finger protein 569-like [Penaeus indicus]|uniref:zinc finger protein 569-like n=1 Tax=Penaeus indicus TaxID=29960 RepID=UPI00300CCF06
MKAIWRTDKAQALGADNAHTTDAIIFKNNHKYERENCLCYYKGKLCNECVENFRIEKPFNCEIFLKAFPSKNVLARHIKVHTREKPYSCENCSKVFPEKGHLATHMRVHTKEKPYSYEVCNKAFSHKSNLVIHMRVHTKEKPFETKALLQVRRDKVENLFSQSIMYGLELELGGEMHGLAAFWIMVQLLL